MFLELMCYHKWLRTMCSITLHRIHVNEIGFYLAGLLLLPFCILVIAVVQAYGNLSVVYDGTRKSDKLLNVNLVNS